MSDYPVLKNMNFKGKKVLVRVDYNVKVKEGKIKDDTRIRESLDTINMLTRQGARTILMAHYGRPQEELAEGKSVADVRKGSSVAPIAKHLGGLLKKEVKLAPDCKGPAVEQMAKSLKDGDVMMIENIRWYAEEEANDPAFAAYLAGLADAYVFDGFGVSHRAHASSAGVPLKMIKDGKPVAAGCLMDKELNLWQTARNKPGSKLLVIGGAKLTEKTKAVSKLAKAVNQVLVGGAVYNVIMAGKGINVGDSLVTEGTTSFVETGKELAGKVKNLLLADQVTIARKGDFGDIKSVPVSAGVPAGYMIVDLVVDGKLKAEIGKADVIICFGNPGLSDMKIGDSYPFAKGTEDLVKAMKPGAYVIVGGGDSASAYASVANKAVSTGGGASIQLFTKGTLEALEALKGNAAFFAEKK